MEHGIDVMVLSRPIFHDGKQRSCNAAITHATRCLVEQGLQPPGSDSGDYCRARQKLSADVLRQLVRDIAESMTQRTPAAWLWQSKQVKLVDGFTFTMPDTPNNQRVFPLSNSQTSGLGFPIARTCVVLSLAHACIEAIAVGPHAGSQIRIPGSGFITSTIARISARGVKNYPAPPHP